MVKSICEWSDIEGEFMVSPRGLSFRCQKMTSADGEYIKSTCHSDVNRRHMQMVCSSRGLSLRYQQKTSTDGWFIKRTVIQMSMEDIQMVSSSRGLLLRCQ